MATLFELAQEISKKTGVKVEDVKAVLYALGDGVIEAMKKDPFSDYRLQIPKFGVFKIEKLPSKRKAQLVFYPAPAIQDYKIKQIIGGQGWKN